MPPVRKPTFLNQISVGNLLQILVLLVGLTSAWFVMDTRSKINSGYISEIRTDVADLQTRMREVERSQARSDERFSNILTLLARIDKRLERIEQNN